MENFPRKLKTAFFSMLLGAVYGGVIGLGLAVLPSNYALAGVGVFAGALAGVGTLAEAGVLVLAAALVGIGTLSLASDLTEGGALVGVGALTGGVTLTWTWAFLEYLANRNKTTREALIENHIAWIFSFQIAIFRLLSSGQSFVKSNKKSKIKQRALDVSLVITFSQKLAEVFPEEWNEWQHWISDIMDSRTRMQSKGINHRLVSLITFYRLTRFAFHIGIDKVFILATRRATR